MRLVLRKCALQTDLSLRASHHLLVAPIAPERVTIAGSNSLLWHLFGLPSAAAQRKMIFIRRRCRCEFGLDFLPRR